MKSEQVGTEMLINEWQLGSQLNVAIHKGTRNKFNLLLSLLSDDVRDFSQFDLPKIPEFVTEELALRAQFSLSETQPLVNKGHSLAQAQKISRSVHQKDLADIRLQSLLNNEAILSRQHAPLFERDVMDNLSCLTQARLTKNESGSEHAEKVAQGIDNSLMQQYQALDFKKNPVKVHYM